MLLDTEEVLASCSSHLMNKTQFDDQQLENIDSDPCDGSHNSDSGGFDNESRNNQLPGGHEHSHRWDGHNIEEDYTSAQDYDNFSPTQAETEPRGQTSEESPILGIPFSPTLIKHPIPRSSKVSSILNSGSSEIANSTAAQVGKVKPVVPSSQVLDNETWETWMAPLLDEVNCQPKNEEDSVAQERSISPGISTAPARRISRPAPKRYQKAPPIPVEHEVEDFNELEKASRMTNPSSILETSSDEDDLGGWEPPRNVSRRKPESLSRMRRGQEFLRDIQNQSKKSVCLSNSEDRDIKYGTDNRNILQLQFTGLQSEASFRGQSTVKSKKDEDPDDIWRMFVFGTSRDEASEPDPAFKPTAPPSTETQGLLVSSMEGNLSPALSAKSPMCTLHQNSNTPNSSNSAYKSHTPSTVSNASKVDTSSSEIPWSPPIGFRPSRNRIDPTGNNSLQTSDGSSNTYNADHLHVADTSHTSSIPRHVATSMTVGITSSQSAASKSAETPPSPKHQTVVSTRPKCYEGLEVASQSSPAHQEPFHVGRGLLKDIKARSNKKKERDIYSLVDSDEILDD
jgi:hypothetical protein